MHESLKTDLYQLTMMAAQYYKGLCKQVVTCEAFVRKLPIERKFLVMAGTEEIRNYLLNLRFSRDDISFLKTVPALKQIMDVSNFEKFLADFKFQGDLWAMAEGEIIFPGEPLVRITGTLPEVHIAETFILSVLNHDIKVASKAARIVLAARGKPVLEFGTRRTHHEAAVNAARAAYLTGFSATSNVEASRRFGIPLKGTMSHMWVMVNGDELRSFNLFQDCYKNPVLLIDTYDTLTGALNASKISGLEAVRLDSGNLGSLSRMVRSILDNNNRSSAKIIVSGDLNEYAIDELSRSGAPIDSFAVGTELVVSSDVPSLGVVYKVVYDETNNKALIKMATNKVTLPGRKQVFLDQRDGKWSHLLAIDGCVKSSEKLLPLLDQLIKDGEPISDGVDLEVARKYCNAALLSIQHNLASLSPMPKMSVPVFPHSSVQEMFEKAVKEHELNMG